MAPERALDFDRDGRDWPNRDASRFVQAGGIRWHVQQFGEGPPLLLLHGTGAATHSWRGLAPLLSPHFRLTAVDLPGHGFTQRPPQRLFTLPGMAAGIADLLRTLDVAPVLVIGHSAGAAVMLRFALDCRRDGGAAPRGLVSINGALKPYGGNAARWMAPVAKALFLNPFTPRLFAWRAGGRAAVERLIRNTGSTVDPEGVGHYSTLVANPDHVAAALGMMANWDLQPLARDMPGLDVPLLLIAGGNDRAIKPDDVHAVRALVPGARAEVLRGLGHLAHEEAPDAVAPLVIAFARAVGAVDAVGALSPAPAPEPP